MRSLFGLSLLALLCAGGIQAQIPGSGAVTGLVLDPYGDGLPDTAVVLSNPALGIHRAMTTTDWGVFHASGLPPAPGYSLKIGRKGFVAWESKTFPVSVGQAVDFRVTLAADTPEKQVIERPTTSEEGSSVSRLLTRKEIDDLPILGRSWTAALLLAPAATGVQTVPAVRGVLGANAYYFDGLDLTSTFYSASPGVSRQVALNAVNEVQALTATAPIAFSGASGGTLNAASRSGSKQFHGEIYDYFRNQSLNAPDRYAAGWNPGQRQHQGGASLGGSLWPNKLFFFANFEALSYRGAGLNRITNPMIADSTGTHVLSSNCTATTAQCAAVTKFIQSQMNVEVPRSIHSDTGLVRIDFHPTERNAVSITGDAMAWRAPNGVQRGLVSPDGSLLGNNGNLKEKSRFGRASWTRLLGSSAVNDLRLGWSRDRWSENDESPSFWPSTGPLAINVAGTWLGKSPALPYTLDEEKRRVGDIITFTSANHTVQAGADWLMIRDSVDQLYARSGMYSYSTLTAFASDFSGITAQRKNYTLFNQALADGGRHFRPAVRTVFAQDTYKIVPRLTVEFGVRWEKPKLPQPTVVSTDYYQTGVIPQTNTDAAPHAGVAFMANESTVLRFGYGWYYAPYAGELLDALFLGAQNIVSINGSQTNSPIFPNIVTSTKNIPAGTESLAYSAGKLRNPFTKQAAFSIEHRVGADTFLTLSFVDSPGVKLWSNADQNLAAPTKTVTYTINDASGKAAGKFATSLWTAKNDPRYAHLYQIENLATSKYDAVSLQVRKQMSYGVAFQGSYTWSHAIDNVGANPLIGLGSVNTYNGDYNSDRGNSAADQRHRAVINWIWQPTLGAGAFPVARYLVNGWQVSGIATLASAQSVTALALATGQQFSGSTPLYTNSLNGSGGWARVPFYPVNSLRLSPQYNLNARLSRTFSFGERLKASVMFEAFNAFNRQWLTGVNTVAYLATSGILKPVAGAGAGNATFGPLDGTNARRCQVAARIVF